MNHDNVILISLGLRDNILTKSTCFCGGLMISGTLIIPSTERSVLICCFSTAKNEDYVFRKWLVGLVY